MLNVYISIKQFYMESVSDFFNTRPVLRKIWGQNRYETKLDPPWDTTLETIWIHYLFFFLLLCSWSTCDIKDVNCTQSLFLDRAAFGVWHTWSTLQTPGVHTSTHMPVEARPACYLLRKAETSLRAVALRCLYIERQTGRKAGDWGGSGRGVGELGARIDKVEIIYF